MARYIGPTCKLARREGADLSLKSPARALDSKCKLGRSPASTVPPPQGQAVRLRHPAAREAEGQAHLRLLERQFRNYYKKAATKKGNTGENLLQMLEDPPDNVVYRMGFAVTVRPRASWSATAA